MMYIFDQQTGTLAALGVMLDCVFSLLRQRILRPHVGIDLPAASLQSPASDHIPSFGILEASQPCASAIIHGMMLSLILFYWQFNSMNFFAISYSLVHVSKLHIQIPAGSSTQPVDVIPTEADNPQSKNIASSSPRAAAAAAPLSGAMILHAYVGKYISQYPSAKISIQIERNHLSGDHLSLWLAAAGHPSLALSPVSPARFTIVGAENSYVDFTADAQGRIWCLSLALNGNFITAERQ